MFYFLTNHRASPAPVAAKGAAPPSTRFFLERGLTLIELMVGIAITAILLSVAAPSLSDYVANARLRAAADQLVAAVAAARSEAIRRNVPVRLEVTANGSMQINALDPSTNSVTENLRSWAAANGIQATPVAVTYDAFGLVVPFGTNQAVTLSAGACGEDIRCPAVRLMAGGATQICPTGVCP